MSTLTLKRTTLPATRRPISPEQMAAATNTDRLNHLRCTGREPGTRHEIEAMLNAELEHATKDWYRCNNPACYDLDAPGEMKPWHHTRLLRETAAAKALNALTHASIQARMLREGISRLRSARRGATARAQSTEYRQAWASRIPTALEDVGQHHRRRQRAWREFLRLLTEYQEAAR